MYTLSANLTKNKHLQKERTAIKLERVQVLQVWYTVSQMMRVKEVTVTSMGTCTVRESL